MCWRFLKSCARNTVSSEVRMTIMRKKSKKKQIVAMTLALSVLSSSVGMCGASAAEALPDTDDSGLQVTVVPLADSNADTDTPCG